MTKRCTRCHVEREELQFAANPKSADSLNWWCRICERENVRAWKQAHPDEMKAAKRLERYGLTLEMFHDLVCQQNNSCAICGSSFDDKTLNVDHDHVTGAVRGLLCFNCNAMLGNAHDSMETLVSALIYLERER